MKPTKNAQQPAFRTLEPEAPKKSSRTPFIVLVSLLVLALAGGVAAYVWQQQRLSDMERDLASTTNQVEDLKAENKSLQDENASAKLTDQDDAKQATLTKALAVVKAVYDGRTSNGEAADKISNEDALMQEHLTPEFYDKWIQPASYDIVGCAQQPAESYRYNAGSLTGTNAAFEVTGNYGAQTTQLTATVDTETMKLAAVSCPQM